VILRDNWFKVKEYLAYLREVQQRDAQTVKRIWLWLVHILQWCDDAPLVNAPALRPTFPYYISHAQRRRGDEMISPVGVERATETARAFFTWLAQRSPRAYSKITPAWINTLQPPSMPETEREHVAVTLDMVMQLIALPNPTLPIRRDQAAAALLFLSGARARAFCTLPIECVDIAGRVVRQLPSMGVHTKLQKSAVTRLLEIPALIQVAEDWDGYLRQRLPLSAPWWPVIDIRLGEYKLVATAPGPSRPTNLAVRIRKLFELAGLPPLSPHKFRHGHAVYALQGARTVADLKAVSQNLMHANLSTTDGIYAILDEHMVHERIARLGTSAQRQTSGGEAVSVEEIIRQITKEVLSKLDNK
jgi:integrase